MSYKMVDLANTPQEIKEDVAGYSVPSPVGISSGPLYPYGLCLRLEEKTLDRLGMAEDLPEVGDVIHIVGMAKVTSVSENETETTDGERQHRCCVELQITHMGAEDEDMEDPEARLARSESREKERSSSFYGDEEEE